MYGGTLIYQGDLSESLLGYTHSLKPAIGVFASESLDDYFSVRANITRGEISADESTYSSPAWRRERNWFGTYLVKRIAPASAGSHLIFSQEPV